MPKLLIPLRFLRNCTRNFCKTRSTFTIKVVNGGSGSGHADNSGGRESTGPMRDSTGTTTGTSGGQNYFRTWELHSYNYDDGPDLQLAMKTRLPILKRPTDVLIKVYASSVNPIDVAMTKGYGHATINFLRDFEASTKYWSTLPSDLCKLVKASDRIEFPLVLGRDFAGVVSQTGHGVKDFTVGDEVYGVCGVHRSGCHSDYVVTSSQMIKKKPKNLSFVESSCIPYVGLTTWSAIRLTGGFQNLHNMKFLVIGGSGGVGTFLIQYLKAHGSYVVSTCSSDALILVESLGCDFAVDYKAPDYASQIKQDAPFDCILDLSGLQKQSELIMFLKPGVGQYITLSPPFLSNIDKFGLSGGLIRNLNDIVWENWNSMQKMKVPTKWAFFIPFGQALEKFTTLIEGGQIKPVIQEVFNFDNLPTAYKKLDQGHARGKIVMNFQNKII